MVIDFTNRIQGVWKVNLKNTEYKRKQQAIKFRVIDTKILRLQSVITSRKNICLKTFFSCLLNI